MTEAGPWLHERSFDLKALLPGDYYCAGCAERVCAVLRETAGVEEVVCDLADGLLTVRLGPLGPSREELEAEVTRIVLEATDRARHAVFRITGLD